MGDGFLPLTKPLLGDGEWENVRACLETGWLSSAGAFVEQFERQLAEYLGCDYAVAMASGTAALHLALLVAGVQPGDEVLLPALTFIAPANAIRYVGAWPVCIDVEPEHWQIDVQQVQQFLEGECRWAGSELRNRRTGRRVSALLPVHLLGHPCDIDVLRELAAFYRLVVVEDAAESLGASYRGRKVGRPGDVACLSFNGNKIITTGGGGMLVCNNAARAQRAKSLSTQAKSDPHEYIHQEIGYNYRLNNLQAAIGCAQLEQLDAAVAAHRRITTAYNSSLADLPGIRTPHEADWAHSNCWLYSILVDAGRYGCSARELRDRLANRQIQSRPLWQPIHQSPAQQPVQTYGGEVAAAIYAQALSLPTFRGMRDADIERVVRVIRDG